MDSAASSGGPGAGWYDDFENPDLLRYWDGTGWTAHTQSRATPAQAPPIQLAPAQPGPIRLAPARVVPVQAAPVQDSSVQGASVQGVPVQGAPVQTASSAVAPAREIPSQTTSLASDPVQLAAQPAPAQPRPDWPSPAQPGVRQSITPGAPYLPSSQADWSARPPASPPGAGYPGTGYPDAGYSGPVTPHRSPLQIVGLVLVLLMGFLGVKAALSHAFDEDPAVPGTSSTGQKAPSGPATGCDSATPAQSLPSALSATPKSGPVITPAGAKAVLKAVWTTRERALTSCDLATIAVLDTGSAKIGDTARARCGCLIRAGTPYTATRFFVPRQTRFPAYFVAEARTVDTGGNSWTEIMALVRSGPKSPWQLSLATGYTGVGDELAALGKPVVDADGYVKLPDRRTRQAGAALGPRLARFYQEAKNTGKVPANPFQSTYWTTTLAPLIAAHKQDAKQGNGLHGHFTYTVDREAPLFQVTDADQALVCTALTVRSVYGGGGKRGNPQQSTDRLNWGLELPPGVYKTITQTGVSQTCFLLPLTGGPAPALGGDYGVESTSTGIR